MEHEERIAGSLKLVAYPAKDDIAYPAKDDTNSSCLDYTNLHQK